MLAFHQVLVYKSIRWTAMTDSEYTVDREEVERLAYSYWEARGCPEDSPEEDWYRAEAELLARAGESVSSLQSLQQATTEPAAQKAAAAQA